MVEIEIRPGTDIRWPSYRVKILGQPALPETRRPDMSAIGVPEVDLEPLDTGKLTQRELAFVFTNGESAGQIRDVIAEGVRKYLDGQVGEPVRPDRAVLEMNDVSTP